MDVKDYYQVLGVPTTAETPAIKQAFRRLARQHHPDINPAPDAADRMQGLNEAYEVLRDPQKRALYDQARLGGAEFSMPGGGGGFDFGDASHGPGGSGFEGDHSEFFEALFGAARRQGRGARERGRSHARDHGFPEPPLRGQDHHAKIVVPLLDAFHGATRTFTFQRPEIDEAGRGVLRERSLQVAIPKGIRAGQQIRLSGQGAAGLGDAPPGDLYLEVAFEAHPLWRVEGRDLHLRLPVAPWEAALGAAIDLPTPDGPVTLQVPAGSQTGRSLRLRGRGLPGREPGHLYVRLDVVLPPAADDRAREAYRSFARDLAFDPRAHLGTAT